MATAKVTAQFEWKDAAFAPALSPTAKSFTPTGTKANYVVLTLSTTAETVPLGEVSTIGQIGIHNLNTTGTDAVLVSFDDGTTFPIKVLPGHTFTGHANGVTVLKVKSSAGTPRCAVLVGDA